MELGTHIPIYLINKVENFIWDSLDNADTLKDCLEVLLIAVTIPITSGTIKTLKREVAEAHNLSLAEVNGLLGTLLAYSKDSWEGVYPQRVTLPAILASK